MQVAVQTEVDIVRRLIRAPGKRLGENVYVEGKASGAARGRCLHTEAFMGYCIVDMS